MANELRYRATIKDDVSGPLERLKDRFGQLRVAGAKPFFQGLAMGVGQAAFNAMGDAIQNVVGWLGESIGKAREEEAGIARLNRALSENVKGYNGNSDAIEEVIAAREKLAFSDGEQRDALAVLVARTKDYQKALDLERTAMDLARLKGIDLSTASEVIGKVYSGNVGILGRYGIAVRKGADATEALADVQKAAAGQAETFANTTEGSMQSAQIAIEDLQEEIGVQLLPVLKDVSQWVRDEGVPALKSLVDAAKEMGPIVDILVAMAHSADVNRSSFATANDVYEKTKDHFADLRYAASHADEAIRDFRKAERDSLGPTWALAGKVGNLTDENEDLAASFDDVSSAIKRLQSRAQNAFSTLDDLIGITKRAIAATAGAYEAVSDPLAPKKKKKKRAGGGPVSAGETYLVGENGPELLTMGDSSNGTINPSAAGAMGGGSGGPVVINVMLPDGTRLASVVAPGVTAWQQQRRLIPARA